jgi:glucose dehydrogenase
MQSADCGLRRESDRDGEPRLQNRHPEHAASTARASASWPYPNADVANTRNAPDSTISSANVSGLEQAWTFKLSGAAAAGVGGSGSLAANPIVRGGVVYLQYLDSNVYAVALTSGTLEWEYECNAPERTGPEPNGVAVADGRVYGETPTYAVCRARLGRRLGDAACQRRRVGDLRNRQSVSDARLGDCAPSAQL